MSNQFGESFDSFLEATAEAAITHVVSAAKGILETVTIYLVSERPMEYNDEYHYFEGGSYPRAFFLDKDRAEKNARERTMAAFTPTPGQSMYSGNWSDNSCFEIGGSYDNDALKEFITKYMGIGDSDKMWDVKYKEILEVCQAEGLDPMDYLPNLYEVVEVQPG